MIDEKESWKHINFTLVMFDKKYALKKENIANDSSREKIVKIVKKSGMNLNSKIYDVSLRSTSNILLFGTMILVFGVFLFGGYWLHTV